MKDAVRTAVGVSLIAGVLLGLSGNIVIPALLLEKDFRAWDDNVSKKLDNRELSTYLEKSRFDTLGLIEPGAVYGDPRVDRLFAQLRMKLDRLSAAIRGAKQRQFQN